jgi:hypothetical protein
VTAAGGNLSTTAVAVFILSKNPEPDHREIIKMGVGLIQMDDALPHRRGHNLQRNAASQVLHLGTDQQTIDPAFPPSDDSLEDETTPAGRRKPTAWKSSKV